MGLDLASNRSFADGAGAIASAAEEGFKWYDTFHNKKPVWDAYGNLTDNQSSFDKAVSLTDKYKSGLFRASVANFINDGTLPNLNFSKLSLQGGINIMQAGMSLMKQNNIPIREGTQTTFNLYQKLLQILNDLNKKSHSQQQPSQ